VCLDPDIVLFLIENYLLLFKTIKKNIRLIYDASKQNYGAPKITKELRKSGETIAERTVGKYMHEMGIKA